MMKSLSPKQICSRIGIALFAMMVIWQSITITVVSIIPKDLLENGIVYWTINDIALYFIAVPIFLLIMKSVPNAEQAPPRVKKLRVRDYILALLFGFGGTYIVNIVSNTFLSIVHIIITGEFLPDMSNLNALTDNTGTIGLLIFGVLIPSFGEEFLFRHVLWKKLRSAGDKTYIFFSALCFGLFHANFSQSLYVFLVGVIFAWAYVLSGRLWVPITMHFIFNFVGIIIVPLALESTVAMLIMSGMVMLLIITAIVIFVVGKKYMFSTMRPPQDAAWPYNPPKPVMKWVNGYGYMQESKHPYQEFNYQHEKHTELHSQNKDTSSHVYYPIEGVLPAKQVAAPAHVYYAISNTEPVMGHQFATQQGYYPNANTAYGYNAQQYTTPYPPPFYNIHHTQQKAPTIKTCLLNLGMIMFMLVAALLIIFGMVQIFIA